MKLFRGINKAADALVVILFAALVSLVLLQVITRMFHLSQVWIDEISKFVFVWTTYIGGSITVRRGMNITFDLILDSRKGKSYKILFFIVNALCVLFMAAIFFLGLRNAYANRVQYSTMTRLNMGLVNLAIPIGFLLMIGSQIEYYFRRLREHEEEEKAEPEKKNGGEVA